MEGDIEQPCTPRAVYSAFVKAKLNCSIRVLGSQMGLDPPDLDAIDDMRLDIDQQLKLLKMLEKCFSRAIYGLTWNQIADVLKKPALREYRVASHIEQHHVRRQSSVSSSLTLSPLSSLASSDNVWTSPSHSMEIGIVLLCYNSFLYSNN